MGWDQVMILINSRKKFFKVRRAFWLKHSQIIKRHSERMVMVLTGLVFIDIYPGIT